MKTSRKIATFAAGAALVSGVAFAVPAMAEDSSTPNATSSSAAQKSPGDRISTALSGLVEDGTITQAQSDKVAAAMKPDGQGHEGRGGPGGHGPGMRGPGAAEVRAAAAKALGLTEAQLETKLQSQSLGEIADAQKVSRDTVSAVVKKAMTGEFEASLDERVTQMLSAKTGDRPGHPGDRGQRDQQGQGDQQNQGGQQRGSTQDDAPAAPGAPAPSGSATSGA